MPTIPGVAGAGFQSRKYPTRNLVALIAVALLVACIAITWWVLRAGSSPGNPVAASPQIAAASAPAELPPLPTVQPRDKNEIGAVNEFPRPWTAKKFSYSRLVTHEEVPAIAIRLPAGNGRTAASYWVILLKTPYGQCELEYIADVKEISRRFNYSATHPMVADPCHTTLYDPLRMGTLPNGTWSRGEIVLGAGFRPPMQIEIRIHGERLAAVRAED